MLIHTVTIEVNEINIEEFRGYTIKLWLKDIVPPPLTPEGEPTAVLNIYVTR